MNGNNRRVCGAVSNQFSRSREQTRVRDHFGHEDCGMVDVEGGCKRERESTAARKGRNKTKRQAGGRNVLRMRLLVKKLASIREPPREAKTTTSQKRALTRPTP